MLQSHLIMQWSNLLAAGAELCMWKTLTGLQLQPFTECYIALDSGTGCMRAGHLHLQTYHNWKRNCTGLQVFCQCAQLWSTKQKML